MMIAQDPRLLFVRNAPKRLRLTKVATCTNAFNIIQYEPV